MMGLETIFLSEPIETIITKITSLINPVTFKLQVYHESLVTLSKDKVNHPFIPSSPPPHLLILNQLERESHNQGVSSRGSEEQTINRLLVVEYHRLMKNLKGGDCAKKFNLQEAKQQMSRFNKFIINNNTNI